MIVYACTSFPCLPNEIHNIITYKKQTNKQTGKHIQQNCKRKKQLQLRGLYAHYLFMPNACAIKICELVTKSICENWQYKQQQQQEESLLATAPSTHTPRSPLPSPRIQIGSSNVAAITFYILRSHRMKCVGLKNFCCWGYFYGSSAFS